MGKKILLLGAGLVTRPLVDYLLKHGFELTIASRTLSKAEHLLESAGGPDNGVAVEFDIEKHPGRLGALVGAHDLAISLLPYTHHVTVARECIARGKHLVTTSYVSPAMKELDEEARAAGVLLLNEIGLDPGIDHMSAMRIIDDVHAKGGKVNGFVSSCGGLPAPDANDNPFGYKFSWSPRGVLLAGRNGARYLKDGNVVEVAPLTLFEHDGVVDVPDFATFESYPNRDSIPYVDIYGIPETKTMLRNTLRNSGWCELLRSITGIGLLGTGEMEIKEGQSKKEVLASIIGANPESCVRCAVSETLGLDNDGEIMEKLAWAGLFDKNPAKPGRTTPLDFLCSLLQDRMAYRKGERDMIVLHHDFDVEGSDGKTGRVTSTLIDYGIPNGDSAMSRTVSLPAAIATRLILEGKIGETGVQIPTNPEIYNPVLDELAEIGIKCRDKVWPAG